MSGYGSTNATGSTSTMAGVGADVMDVILRGLETAHAEEHRASRGSVARAPRAHAYWYPDGITEVPSTPRS
ncbi:hypothetical protein [Knoellia sp. LjRoot47]|uniref:hypothetical protein n=1 Tax=Knoellia sp. LjRoot47 TaxID=3342330 RepID=UPI003ECFA840